MGGNFHPELKKQAVLVNAIFIMCAVIALSLQQWQNFGYHEKEKAATGLEPVTAKPFLPNPYLDYFDKLEFTLINIFQTLYDYQSGLL